MSNERLRKHAEDWLYTLENIASNVDDADKETHMTQFEKNLLESLQDLLGDD